MKLFIDTNVFVSILNKENNYHESKEILKSIHKGKNTGATSVICIAEILSGFYSKKQNDKAERFLLNIASINNFQILDVNIQIAKETAIIRGKYRIKLPDAIIAATCKMLGFTLVTKDDEFKKIKEIRIKEISRSNKKIKAWLDKEDSRKNSVSLLEIKPESFGKQNSRLSIEIDEIFYTKNCEP